jgi:hypothetical protein
MAHKKRAGCIQAAALIAVATLAGLCLVACGGTSKDTSASTAATSTSSSTAGPPEGAGRFAALRTCLQKEGITLPRRPAGQHGRPVGGGPPRGGFVPGSGRGFAGRLPKGVSAERMQAALKKCGGGFGAARGRFFGRAGAKKALSEFAACMNENGIKLPAPNTSGQGPVFDTKGIDTSGTRFKSAEAKCASKLPASFARPGNAPAPPYPGGA